MTLTQFTEMRHTVREISAAIRQAEATLWCEACQTRRAGGTPPFDYRTFLVDCTCRDRVRTLWRLFRDAGIDIHRAQPRRTKRIEKQIARLQARLDVLRAQLLDEAPPSLTLASSTEPTTQENL